jgi:glycosyltransferase involved in cell wall biosynthesis
MKLKNLIIYYPSFEKGGVEKIIKNLIFYFETKKVNVFLISENNNNLKFLNKLKFVKLISPKFFFFSFMPLRFNRAFNCFFPLINLLNKLDNKNTVVHSMQSSYLPILISKIYNFKIVIRNSEDPISSIKYSENKFSSYLIFLLRFIFYNFADKIITNSKGSANSLRLFMFGNNKKKIQYIYNPYLTKKKIEISKKKVRKKNIILAVGRLCKQKNFEDLINAFTIFSKTNKKFILKIVGQGYQKQHLNNLISSLKMTKKIFLLGYMNSLEKIYKQSKLFVLPSIYEGLGNVLIDALNFNLPCIATNCKSGPEEILCKGKAGYIVPIKNVNELVKKIHLIFNEYPKALKKAKFGNNKLYRFNAEKQSKKYLNYLNSTL